MILEIDNIIRSIRDIRKALLSLDTQVKKADVIIKVAKIKELANQMEFETRGLEFELTGK